MGENTVILPESVDQIDGLLDVSHDSWYFRWLMWLCRQLPHATAALIVSDINNNGQFSAVAVWPEDSNQDALLQDTAEQTLHQKKPLITPLDEANQYLGSYPVLINAHLRSVVVLKFSAYTESELQKTLSIIEYCSGWIELAFSREMLGDLTSLSERQHVVLDSMAHVLGERDFDHAALRFVNLMVRHLAVDRVVLGFTHNNELRIHSESDSSGQSNKHELVRLTREAMQETVDQQETVIWPEQGDAFKVSVAHKKLAEQSTRALMTIPLVDRELCYGAILLERPDTKPFTYQEQLTAEALTNFVGVVLEDKRQSNLSYLAYTRKCIHKQLSDLVGPGHLTRKIVFSCVMFLSLFFAIMPGSYTIAADTVLEGAELRSVVVPFDSYLLKAQYRGGDSVRQGDVLAELDTREQRLQRISWLSQQATSRRQYEDALSKQERSKVQISNAQIQRAQAEIELLDYQISQAIMKAPFDALIVSGDLNQRIGSLIQQGEVLFELSPSERYRLAIYVNEYRINDIKPDQSGQLVLAALPDEKFSFTVTRINPRAEVRDGETVYLVEAELIDRSDMLRVGLEGVSQIYVDERLLIRVWTQNLIDWAKLQLWRFWG